MAAAHLAAHQAVIAVGELLRYGRHGSFSRAIPFEEEVALKLAEALKLAIEIENPQEHEGMDPEARALFLDLHRAASALIEGWPG